MYYSFTGGFGFLLDGNRAEATAFPVCTLHTLMAVTWPYPVPWTPEINDGFLDAHESHLYSTVHISN